MHYSIAADKIKFLSDPFADALIPLFDHHRVPFVRAIGARPVGSRSPRREHAPIVFALKYNRHSQGRHKIRRWFSSRNRT